MCINFYSVPQNPTCWGGPPLRPCSEEWTWEPRSSTASSADPNARPCWDTTTRRVRRRRTLGPSRLRRLREKKTNEANRVTKHDTLNYNNHNCFHHLYCQKMARGNSLKQWYNNNNSMAHVAQSHGFEYDRVIGSVYTIALNTLMLLPTFCLLSKNKFSK